MQPRGLAFRAALKIARWITQFSEYRIRVVHRPGKSDFMSVADGLSRIGARYQDDPPMDRSLFDWADETHLQVNVVVPLQQNLLVGPRWTEEEASGGIPACKWYRDIIVYLERGESALTGTREEARRMRKRAIRFTLVGRDLMYAERRRNQSAKWSDCCLSRRRKSCGGWILVQWQLW